VSLVFATITVMAREDLKKKRKKKKEETEVLY
jgi:hypothetical protein